MLLMSDQPLFDLVIAAFLAMSGWEVFAALLGIGYVIFAARESQWCWPLAFVSTFIYAIIFWDGNLPMQAFLNAYYLIMAVYGYFLWRKQGVAENTLPISSWSLTTQLQMLILGSVLTYIVGRYLTQADASQNPYLDAGVTVFSVLNTWLMAKKVLQNWLYWIVIDAAAIVLYIPNGYYATIVMFSLYLVLATLGYINWQRLYQQQSTSRT